MENKLDNLIKDIARVNQIDNKSIPERVMKFNEEFGEYITETIKLMGFTYKPFDREHFIEEGADSLQTLLSIQLAACEKAGVDFQEVLDRMPEKNRKWEDKSRQYTRNANEPKIIRIAFYKQYSADGKLFSWYVDLPDYPGNQGDLQMVMGADTLLTMLSDGKPFVLLNVSLDYFEGSNCLEFMADDMISGADYFIHQLNGIQISLNVWLCEVVKKVFTDYPKLIYFKKA
jgi:NTP pyrophosphatase (non-canonical NTP hydrolase)